ncbi:hypothetical protein [Microbacterium sp. PMB16]
MCACEWSFAAADLDALRSELKSRSLRIMSEWEHEDGIAFIVADSRV